LPVLALAFSSDGRYLASGGMDKVAKVWDTTNWECWQTLTGQQSWTTTVAFSPQPIASVASPNYQLLVGGGDRSIRRWDLTTGTCLATYTGHTNWVWSIVYSPDGTKIYSASEDETIKIWHVDRSQSVHTLQLKRPYEDTNIAGATGIQPGQRQTLQLLGAIDN
jgi:WD40 repeat protein